MNDRSGHHLAALSGKVTKLLAVVTFLSCLSDVQASNVIVRLGEEGGASAGQVQWMWGGLRWETLCASHFSITALMVICKQLGFLGANRVNSGSHLDQLPYPIAPFSFFCQGSEDLLDECQLVPTSCSSASTASGKCYTQESGYLGCFQYMADNNTLDDLRCLQAADMTIGRCQSFCQIRKYRYCGLVNGDQCHCQNVSIERRQWNDSFCQVACGGDQYTSCGGLISMAFFEVPQEIPSQSSTASSTRQAANTFHAVTEAADMPDGIGVVLGASIICTAVVLLVIIVVLLYRKRQKCHASKRGRAGETTDIRQHSSDELTQNPDPGSSQLCDRFEAANTYEMVDRPDMASAYPKDLLLADGPSVKQESTVSRQSHGKAALSVGKLSAMPMKEGKNPRRVDTYDMIDEDPTNAEDTTQCEDDVSMGHGGSGQTKTVSVDSSRCNTNTSELNCLSPTARDTSLVSEKASGNTFTAGVAEISYETINDVFTSPQPLQINEEDHYDDIPNGHDLIISREQQMSGDARHVKKCNSNRSTDSPYMHATPMKDHQTVKREDSFDDSCLVMNEIYSSCSA